MNRPFDVGFSTSGLSYFQQIYIYLEKHKLLTNISLIILFITGIFSSNMAEAKAKDSPQDFTFQFSGSGDLKSSVTDPNGKEHATNIVESNSGWLYIYIYLLHTYIKNI